jgi:hypothetical protein
MSKRLLPIKAMCARYGDVVGKTIDRWTSAGILPAPLVINGRRYWDEEELERRERANMGRGTQIPKSTGARQSAAQLEAALLQQALARGPDAA